MCDLNGLQVPSHATGSIKDKSKKQNWRRDEVRAMVGWIYNNIVIYGATLPKTTLLYYILCSLFFFHVYSLSYFIF